MIDIDPNYPKPQFDIIGRFYRAAISIGANPAGMTFDTADTVVRNNAKNANWLKDNLDIQHCWKLLGEPWNCLVKDTRAYATLVNNYTRAQERVKKKSEKEAAKEASKKTK